MDQTIINWLLAGFGALIGFLLKGLIQEGIYKFSNQHKSSLMLRIQDLRK